MTTPADVLGWWVEELGPEGWYAGGDEIDAEVRRRFGDAYEELREGGYGLWLTGAFGALAYIVMCDQFTRNLFRGSPRSFESDKLARAVSKAAIAKDWDLKVPEPERVFFYMPMMHSENLADQDRAVRLIRMRMPQTGEDYLLHARAHREVIRKFGRFPFRNEALSRQSTAAEAEWLEAGAYGAEVRALKDTAGDEAAAP